MTPLFASFHSAGVFSWLRKSGRIPSQTTTTTCRSALGVSTANTRCPQNAQTIHVKIDIDRFGNLLAKTCLAEILICSSMLERFCVAVDEQQRCHSARQRQSGSDKHNAPKTFHERFVDRLSENLARRWFDILRNCRCCEVNPLVVERLSHFWRDFQSG